MTCVYDVKHQRNDTVQICCYERQSRMVMDFHYHQHV